MSHLTAFLDANVFHSAPMRDVLIQFAMTGIFMVKWSEDIHREWIRTPMNKEPDRNRAAFD